MKISLEWIKEYVDLPSNLTAEQIAYDLTMSTVEVEGWDDTYGLFDQISVGQITTVKMHPDADRLKVCDVNLGRNGTKEIVCGGSNLREGMLVAVAAPGARVRWHGEGELVELKLTKIRGVESFGMICASNEIGLGELFPAEDEKEILNLSSLDLTPGTPLTEALPVGDVVYDIDNKSLTNRPDLWGHYGMARELAAIYSCPLKPLPSFELPSSDGGLSLQIDATDLCRRFTGAIIENVTVESSPLWMQARLARVGQRPINLMVDLTNYVMFALGQPTHAFDATNVSNKKLIVRRAASGETLDLLDGSTLELSPESLVVADENGSLSLAGIMGGVSSGVSDTTNTLIFEVANWDPTHIRRDASRYNIRTESSMRFEKAIDPERALDGSKLFLHLLTSLQPKATVTGWTEHYPSKQAEITIDVERDFIINRIGKEISTEEITAKLSALGFGVSVSNECFHITVPSWRATGDVSIPEDIVEEVARLIGYDNIEFVAPPVVLTKAIQQPRFDLDRSIRTFLSTKGGMYEIFAYPWAEEKFLLAAGFSTEGTLTICDPPSPSTKSLKTSLIPDLLEATKANLRHHSQCSLFEVSRVFHGDSFLNWTTQDEELPSQPKFCAGVVAHNNAETAFLTAKGIVTGLLSSLPIPQARFEEKDSSAPWITKGATLLISVGKREVGVLSLASPKVLR
ncbi:MAG: phenylalanine--tRNA ligase subunit beta, partial [Bdellovibrionales bacterium]|nr:phenylalanine--tRNA ligase subunit beta [Bdellovibrionales bacterium]